MRCWYCAPYSIIFYLCQNLQGAEPWTMNILNSKTMERFRKWQTVVHRQTQKWRRGVVWLWRLWRGEVGERGVTGWGWVIFRTYFTYRHLSLILPVFALTLVSWCDRCVRWCMLTGPSKRKKGQTCTKAISVSLCVCVCLNVWSIQYTECVLCSGVTIIQIFGTTLIPLLKII